MKHYKKIIELCEENGFEPFPSFIDKYNPEIQKEVNELFDYYLSYAASTNDTKYLSDLTPKKKFNISKIEEILKNEEIVDFYETDFKKTVTSEMNDSILKKPKFMTATGKLPVANNSEANEANLYEKKIRDEIIPNVAQMTFDDVVGLENVKKNLIEIAVWPLLRPDLFNGLRSPPKGLLLFGPPGTGKTMIGKCVANDIKATFFSISASSLTSKYVGEAEKLVRALFKVAREDSPSVIFIDEIDSLLSSRSENENEASRRLKTEFLVQFDGVGTLENDRILIIGATNRPQEIDEAARRRLTKRIYVPLPCVQARIIMIEKLLGKIPNNMTTSDISRVASETDGYSGSDIYNLCREASMEPFRGLSNISNFKTPREVEYNDFKTSLKQIRKSVSSNDLKLYEEWNDVYGSI